MNETILNNLIYEYVKKGRKKLINLGEQLHKSVIHLATSKKLILKRALEELESHKVFNELVDKTKQLSWIMPQELAEISITI